MASDWTESTVGEFCPFKYGKGLPERARVPGAYPVMSSAGVVASHTDPLVKTPGVVIGRKGTAGSVTFASGPFWPIDTAFYVEDEPEKRDVRFAYYLLQTLGLSGMNSDSAVPGLNRDNAHAVALRIPPLAEQAEIASVLGALDDRIENLRATNETLEAIVQALFKSWFVDFDPVKAKAEGGALVGMDAKTAKLFPSEFEESELGLVPKGWTVQSLDSFATYLNGLALQKFPAGAELSPLPVIKIAQLRAKHTRGADRASRAIKPEYVVKDGDVLFSWSGTLEVDLWCGGEGALNQHIFKVTSSQVPKWYYFMSTKRHLARFREIAADKATTMGHIQRGHLSAAKCAVPGALLLTKASETFAPLLDAIVSNSVESRTLQEFQDELLPRLISGELRLPGFGDNVS